MAKFAKLRVLISDDHPSMRAGLRCLIDDQSDMYVEGEAHDGAEAFAMARPEWCDVVVLDLEMPKLNGFDCLKKIRSRYPRLPVLVLSKYPDEQYAVQILKSGANGYVSKSAAPDKIVEALRRVAKGQRFISDDIADRLASALTRSGSQQLHENLSLREYQIFYRLARGLKQKQIAQDLCLSAKTVSTYRARLLVKMNLKSNAELTSYSIEQRLLD